jgi:stearoyl-CoA desaturase (delta-9 desaturase)
VLRFIDSTHLLYPLAMGAALYFAGEAYGGLGMSWFVWGFFARTVLVLHATWLVNSATHKWGYRTHETRDDSTNLWWVALVTYGEGWHNNHHAFQTSAAHGLDWWEIDTTYIAIKLMSYVGMASDIKLAKPEKKAARVATVSGKSASEIARATLKSEEPAAVAVTSTAGLEVPTVVDQNTDLVSSSA